MYQNNAKVQIFPDIGAISLAAAETFTSLAGQAIATAGRFCVALSGGSTPKAMHEVLAAPPYRTRIDWSRVHFFWGDERFVPLDYPESNYRMARETLLSKVPVPDKNIFPIRTENLQPQEAAEAYESQLKNFFADTKGWIDLILLGMGEDGHTASLFPYTTALKESTRLVTDNYVEKLNAYRITLTVPAINNAENILFLISGKSKAEAFKQVMTGVYDPERFPAQLVRPHSGNLQFLVDTAAYAH